MKRSPMQSMLSEGQDKEAVNKPSRGGKQKKNPWCGTGSM